MQCIPSRKGINIMSETGQISGKIQAGSRTGDKKEDGYEKEKHNFNVGGTVAVSMRNGCPILLIGTEIRGRNLCHKIGQDTGKADCRRECRRDRQTGGRDQRFGDISSRGRAGTGHGAQGNRLCHHHNDTPDQQHRRHRHHQGHFGSHDIFRPRP